MLNKKSIITIFILLISTMIVSLKEIMELLNQLLNQEKTREYLSDWASLRQQAEDRGELRYDPPEEEDRIWKAIIFLQGIDLKDSPDSYLHDFNDITEFKNDLGT